IEFDPHTYQERVTDMAIDLLACGINPARTILFVQSHVPEHAELQWLLATIAPLGALERMTQYKDKAEQHKDNLNLGLLAYPVLQAADILLYKAQAVPVGEDQVQHLELTREIARKFNHRFGPVFPEPQKILNENVNALLAPICERRAELAERPDDVRGVLREGAERASAIARQTMREVRAAMGLV